MIGWREKAPSFGRTGSASQVHFDRCNHEERPPDFSPPRQVRHQLRLE